MSDEFMLYLDDDGVARHYDDTYDITIHCESEEEQEKAIELIKSRQWIPCSERMPERDQICIVTDETRKCAYEYGFHDETYDNETGWTYLGHKIIAWMPLPEPYKGEQS